MKGLDALTAKETPPTWRLRGRMSVQELRELLERIEDTREIVLGPAPGEVSRAGEPLAVWRGARAEANAALEAWRREPGKAAYAVYRAAEDRADAVEVRELLERHADVLVRGDRGRRLRDGAALAVEAQLGDLAVLHADVHAHLVPAERVVVVGLEVVGNQLAEVARLLVVVEDVVAVQVVHHDSPNRSRARPTEATSASTSARVLYGPKEALAVAGTPRRRISGIAQWWPARMQTLSRSSSSATSWGWTPRSSKEITPPRLSASGGPITRTSSSSASRSSA